MKTQLIRMSVFAVVTAAAVYAQNAKAGKAEIPFDFVMGNQTMPAGQYQVQQDLMNPVLSLASAAGQSQNIVTHAIESVHAQTVGKLVFHRYGNKYFLVEAWTPASNRGLQLATTSQERELAARREIPSGTTVIATK